MKRDILAPTEESTEAVTTTTSLSHKRPVSILQKRIRKFKTLKRGYYSFLILIVGYAISFALPVLVNSKALMVHYSGRYYFPIASYYPASQFGQDAFGEPNYRLLKQQLAAKHNGD